MTLLIKFALVILFTVIEVGGIAALLTLLPGRGELGRRISESFTRAPLLDLWVALLTWVPWVVAAFCAGWIGLFGSLAGQIIVLGTWCRLHEMMYETAAGGPRIVKFLNRTVGRWQNHFALWVTLIALPGFWFIRILEIALYWTLVVLLGFPRYKQSEWINVSRHKFDGLVGHDLIWCLYCDWMTGVYALGAEMLRNVESFWCPIRFYDGKKCENCKVDFPDIDGGWVPASGNMQDVDKVMNEKYTHSPRAWFGHPARLTVNGKPVDPNV
ncbi:MAG TPA: hypothetical protein VHD56_12005 [Tepidisphaeraceae bacterium]|nr:hypothetical protein [Tepidisphaeraceae bacterium]